MPLLVIRVGEPLDVTRVAPVGRLLDDAVAVRPAHLVVDLTECEYLDAAGITLLLDVHKRIWLDGGRMSLHGLSPRLHRILEIARVGPVFGTVSRVEGEPPGTDRRAPGS